MSHPKFSIVENPLEAVLRKRGKSYTEARFGIRDFGVKKFDLK